MPSPRAASVKPTFPMEPKAVTSADGGTDRLSLTPLESGLLLDGPFGEGLHFESLVRDPNPAFDRDAVAPRGEARFGANPGCELGLQPDGHRLIDHLVLDLGAGFCGFARLVVARRLLGRLVAGQLGEGRLDATSFARNQRSRPLLIHDDLPFGT